MAFLKYISYLYLVVAGFFIYDGITKLQKDEPVVLSFLFAGAAIFMFFFRQNFQKKLENRDPKN